MPPVITQSSRKRKSPGKQLAIVLGVVLFAAGVFLFLRKSGKPAVQDIKVPDVKVGAPVQPAAVSAGKAEPAKAEPSPNVEAVEVRTNSYVKKAGQMMLPDGKILTFPPPKEGETRKVAAYGHIYECDSDGNWKDLTKRKLFGTAFEENFLGLAIEGKSFIPAFLTGLDQDEVVKILKKDYVLKGDETEEELANINAYIEMKGAALDYIEQGGKFDDFVNDIASFVRAERQIRAHGIRQVMMLVKAGKIAEAKAKAKAINETIAEQGYKSLRIPAHVQAAFDELPEPGETAVEESVAE